MEDSRIDFENIEKRLEDVLNSEDYAKLSAKVNKATKIYLLGNGGLHYVASHAATDLSRLIPDKSIYSFDSVGFITSNANDHGYEQLFVRWLETMASVEDPEECLIIGMSCSGKSKNIINALNWANSQDFETFMFSGKSTGKLDNGVDELCFNCEYFHTVEVLSLMVFYDLIHKTGNRCPSIDNEIRRKDKLPIF